MEIKIHRCSDTSFAVHFCETEIWTDAPLSFRGDGLSGTNQHSEHIVLRSALGQPCSQVLDVLFDNGYENARAIVTLHGVMCSVTSDDVENAMTAVAQELGVELPVGARF